MARLYAPANGGEIETQSDGQTEALLSAGWTKRAPKAAATIPPAGADADAITAEVQRQVTEQLEAAVAEAVATALAEAATTADGEAKAEDPPVDEPATKAAAVAKK